MCCARDGTARCRSCAVAHERQPNGERRARAVARRDGELATHLAHELAADVETEPRAADAVGHIRIEPVELLEDPSLLLERDADARVGDLEDAGVAVAVEAYVDRPAVGRVLDRVVEQVRDYLTETVRVGIDWELGVVGLDEEDDRLGLVQLGGPGEVLDERDGVDAASVELEL